VTISVRFFLSLGFLGNTDPQLNTISTISCMLCRGLY